jgi:hypothetical protein
MNTEWETKEVRIQEASFVMDDCVFLAESCTLHLLDFTHVVSHGSECARACAVWPLGERRGLVASHMLCDMENKEPSRQED